MSKMTNEEIKEMIKDMMDHIYQFGGDPVENDLYDYILLEHGLEVANEYLIYIKNR